MAGRRKDKRTGVIYTIELDKDGNLVRWDCRPAPAQDADALGQGRLRPWTRRFLILGVFATAVSLLLSSEKVIAVPRMLWFSGLAAGGMLLLLSLALFLHSVNADGSWMSRSEFMEDWILDTKKHRGYKYHDRPGCYVIATYKEPLEDFDDLLHYDNVYVGQSVKVYARVFNHFSGRGNGKVYGDLQYGMHAYVRIYPCRRDQLNDLERQLIAQYHAASSYNKTRGGASRWR